MGGTYGSDGGPRYQGDKVKGAIAPEFSTAQAKRSTMLYATGQVRWNTLMNKNIPSPGRAAMGGTYGAEKGYRYQVDKNRGRIQPVGRGASAYTGKTDLLSIRFGL